MTLIDDVNLNANGYGIVAKDVAAYLTDHGVTASQSGVTTDVPTR